MSFFEERGVKSEEGFTHVDMGRPYMWADLRRDTRCNREW
jgi:hypothetical protein